MPNIVITEKCNLHCAYCFARDLLSEDIDISVDNFLKAVSFIKSSKNFNHTIGIIGGEPLCCKNVRQILTLLIKDLEIRDITLFTNGILIDQYMDLLNHPKLSFLVNINSPDIIGQKTYSCIMKGLEALQKDNKIDRVTLGLNIYDINDDVSYFLECIDRFNFRRTRLSLSIMKENSLTNLDRFYLFRDKLFIIIEELWRRKILFRFDCNYPPQCIWTKSQLLKIMLIQQNMLGYGVDLQESKCTPVLDILPDLTAIRCFGMSRVSRINIDNFSNIDELKEYYINRFDVEQFVRPELDICTSCNMFVDHKCHRGCMAMRY